MKAVVAAFNQEKALVKAFSVITNLRMDLFESLIAGDTVGAESKAAVAKTLFGSSEAAPWLTAEEEAAVVTGFLTDEDKLGLSVDLMRFFLDTLDQLEVGGRQRRLPSDLVRLVASLYSAWRSHWGYQLEYTRPQEPLTQASIRYYILGNEAIVSDLQAREELMPDSVKTQMWADLLELDTIYFELPLNTQVGF